MTGSSEDTEAGLDVLHLDMDAFFASVEVLAAPSLTGKPVVVGGTGPRSVVASASYEARVYGVRSAMAMSEARRRCPNLVVVPGRHDEYSKVSARLREILNSVSTKVEPISIDEAFLEVSGAHGLFGSSREIAAVLRARVRTELSLGCAVGVGRSKLIAKLASKAAKPIAGRNGPRDGLGVLVVTAAEEQDFLHRHEIRALPGVGPRTAERLTSLGVVTVGDLAIVGRERLVRLLGRTHGELLCDLANGNDSRQVNTDRSTRSIGREQTFATDDRDRSSLEARIRELASAVTTRLRRGELLARTISLKVRYGDFTTVTRSRSPGGSTRSHTEIADIAVELLGTLDVGSGVRLLGVSLSGLEPAKIGSARQLALFDESREGDAQEETDDLRREEVDSVTDEIRRRFGDGAISPASSVRRAEPR